MSDPLREALEDLLKHWERTPVWNAKEVNASVERAKAALASAPQSSVDLHDLRATLATMKSAKEKGVNMNIWDRDIEAVESAIIMIEAFRKLPPLVVDIP